MSRRLSDALTDVYERRTRHPTATPTKVASGEWFCPGCGVAMVTEPGVAVSCPSCGQRLNEFLVELVELHSHG